VSCLNQRTTKEKRSSDLLLRRRFGHAVAVPTGGLAAERQPNAGGV